VDGVKALASLFVSARELGYDKLRERAGIKIRSSAWT
jgi:hypothetical protein